MITSEERKNLFRSVDRMTERISEILNGSVHSAWLYGSVVLDDFCPGWSDIDLLVLTDKPITDSQAQKLIYLRQAMMQKDPENPYYRSFEGIIANLDEYRAGSFSRLVYWGTTGQRITDRFEPDVFSRYELAVRGRSVYGSDDRTIFEIPDREEMVTAIRNHYETIRRYAVQTDERLYSCGWLLDIARCIHTLRCNDVIAKTQAGVRALEQHLFTDDEPLKKTLEIRMNPMVYKDRDDVKKWLKGLGPTVQQYADVLQQELSACTSGAEK